MEQLEKTAIKIITAIATKANNIEVVLVVLLKPFILPNHPQEGVGINSPTPTIRMAIEMMVENGVAGIIAHSRKN
jgi:hypothetical protein